MEILDISCYILKKTLDTVSVKKIEEKNKQFLIEKLIHSVEFEDMYATNPEKKNQKSYR